MGDKCETLFGILIAESMLFIIHPVLAAVLGLLLLLLRVKAAFRFKHFVLRLASEKEIWLNNHEIFYGPRPIELYKKVTIGDLIFSLKNFELKSWYSKEEIKILIGRTRRPWKINLGREDFRNTGIVQ